MGCTCGMVLIGRAGGGTGSSVGGNQSLSRLKSQIGVGREG